MVTFRYHFLHFLLFTTGFFDLKYICMGFILSEGKKRCLVVFRYHFGTIRLDYFNCPDKIRIISLLFHFLSCHESSFLLSPVTSVTPQMEEPASFSEFSFCVAFHFSVGANICQIGRSSRVMGNRNPRQDPYLEIHDRVLLSGSCSWKFQAKSRPKEEGQIHIIWILVLRGGSCSIGSNPLT